MLCVYVSARHIAGVAVRINVVTGSSRVPWPACAGGFDRSRIPTWTPSRLSRLTSEKSKQARHGEECAGPVSYSVGDGRFGLVAPNKESKPPRPNPLQSPRAFWQGDFRQEAISRSGRLQPRPHGACHAAHGRRPAQSSKLLRRSPNHLRLVLRFDLGFVPLVTTLRQENQHQDGTRRQ